MQQVARYWIDEVLVKSPFAKSLGIAVVAAEADRVVLRLPFRADLATVGDIVHTWNFAQPGFVFARIRSRRSVEHGRPICMVTNGAVG